jgi:hypothetical protein
MVKIFSSVNRWLSGPFLACHWSRRPALVRRISFKTGVRKYSFERRCAFLCWSSLMMHKIDRISMFIGTWSFVSRAFRRIRSRTVWIAASALTLFRVLTQPFLQSSRVPYNVLLPGRWVFAKFSMVFKSMKIWERDFPQLWRIITATWFSLTPHSMLTPWQMRANCLGTSTWRDSSPKTAIVTTLPPRLQLWTTWKLQQKLWQNYILHCSHWVFM